MRVLDNEPFARAEHLAGDEEGADDVVRDAPARIADDVRIALGDPRKLRGIETAVHAGNDGEAAHRMVRQTTLIAKCGGIALVCCADFFDVRSHSHLVFYKIFTKKPSGMPDGFFYALIAQTARSTLPERRQRVHTLTCFTSPFTRARTR